MAAMNSGSIRVLIIHSRKDLRRQDKPRSFAIPLERSTDHFLASSAFVDVGRIDKVKARIQGIIYDGIGFSFRRFAAEQHSAQAKRADLHSGAPKLTILHCTFPC